MNSRLHCFQHVPFEGLGCIQDWIQRKEYVLSHTRFFEKPSYPNPEDIDFLIVLGGPMNVNEEEKYPWLKEEKEFLADFIKAGKKVLGICLGAQMIAESLGASVGKNPEKEIGWFPVIRTLNARDSILKSVLPDYFPAFHWHSYTFDLPDSSVNLAYSEACMHQAFLFDNRVLGLQFHLEVDLPALKGMLKEGSEDITPSLFVQTQEQIMSETANIAKANKLMHHIMDKMVS